MNNSRKSTHGNNCPTLNTYNMNRTHTFSFIYNCIAYCHLNSFWFQNLDIFISRRNCENVKRTNCTYDEICSSYGLIHDSCVWFTYFRTRTTRNSIITRINMYLLFLCVRTTIDGNVIIGREKRMVENVNKLGWNQICNGRE